MGDIGKRASGSAAAWQTPRAGLRNPAPLDPRKHRNNSMHCVLVGEERDGLAGRGCVRYVSSRRVSKRVTSWGYQPRVHLCVMGRLVLELELGSGVDLNILY